MFDSFFLLHVGRSLWWEDGLVTRVQSLNGPSRAELVTILYCLIWDFPSLVVEVEVKLRSTVSLASPSWCQAPVIKQLRVCYFLAPSLTRGRVCNLLLLLSSTAQSRSGLSPAGVKTIFYCPNSWDSPSLEKQFFPFTSSVTTRRATTEGVPGSRIYIPKGQGRPVISPSTWFPFFHLLRLTGLRWMYSNPPPHGLQLL
jgi:hypothetical protein